MRAYLALHYPATMPAIKRRLQSTLARITAWPESGRRVIERPGVRVAPLIRYPYKIFYRITPDAIEILHIHHTAQNF